MSQQQITCKDGQIVLCDSNDSECCIKVGGNAFVIIDTERLIKHSGFRESHPDFIVIEENQNKESIAIKLIEFKRKYNPGKLDDLKKQLSIYEKQFIHRLVESLGFNNVEVIPILATQDVKNWGDNIKKIKLYKTINPRSSVRFIVKNINPTECKSLGNI